MLQQYINTQSGLISSGVDLSKTPGNKFDLALLPSGAELVMLNIEIIEPSADDIEFSIGLDDDKTFFGQGLKLNKKGFLMFSQTPTMQKKGCITLNLAKNATKGILRLKAVFFYPSQRKIEVF